jgi:hypothetical protein
VDAADALQLNLAGGALTGQVTTNQTPSASDQLVPKSYVDAVGTRATALETKTQLQTLVNHYGDVTKFTDRLMVYHPTYQKLMINTNDSLGAEIISLEPHTNSYRPLNILGTDINVHATGLNSLSCGAASYIEFHGNASVRDGKNLTSDKFVTRNGTSAQFVKGDGTLDSVGYLPKTGGALTGHLTSNSQIIGGGAKILTFGLNWIAGQFTNAVFATVNGTADSPAQNGGSVAPLIVAYLPITTGTVGHYFKSVRWNFENDPGGEVSMHLMLGNTEFVIPAATIASQKVGSAQIDIPPYYTSIRVGLTNDNNGLIRTGRTIVNIGYY